MDQAHLGEALVESNAELRSANGVVIVRLTFHSLKPRALLLASAALQNYQRLACHKPLSLQMLQQMPLEYW